MELDIELVKKCYKEYKYLKDDIFKKVEDYYYGETDSLRNFKALEGRSNLVCKLNLFQKLIDEEAEYSVGNDVTIKSKSGNKEVIELINKKLHNLKPTHNLNLMQEYIKNMIAFEIEYIKKDEFRSKIVTPLNGYMYFDEDEEPVMFLYIYKKKFSDDKTKNYIRIYDDKYIYETDENFENPTKEPHSFKRLPVSVHYEGGIDGRKTMFKLIKTAQDSLETNFSDAVCEISDTRNAILKGKNLKLQEDKDGNPIPPVIRNNTFVNVESDNNDSDLNWMNKNLNEPFTTSILDKNLNFIYTLASHIDNNERMQSNLSGIALRSRLFQLESKCKKNEQALKTIIKHRIRCLFDWVFTMTGKQFDIEDIDIIFTPNIPIDINSIADTLSKVPHEVMSYETRMSMFPNISNPMAEKERIDREKKEEMEGQIDIDSIEGEDNETI